MFMKLSLDELAQPAASRSELQGSDAAYLISVGLVAAVIIWVFFGVAFFVLAQTGEQIIGGSRLGDRGTEIKFPQSLDFSDLSSDAQSVPVEVELPASAAMTSLPVLAVAQSLAAREDLTPENTNPARGSAFPATEPAMSPATGALSSTEAPAVRSATSEVTPGPFAAVPTPDPASGLPVTTIPAMPFASAPLVTEVAELLARGDSFVLIGDVASARVFYERAANAGDGRAAVRMGATFDPVFLRRAGLQGTFGEPAQARSWYRRASGFGALQAERRYGADTK